MGYLFWRLLWFHFFVSCRTATIQMNSCEWRKGPFKDVNLGQLQTFWFHLCSELQKQPKFCVHSTQISTWEFKKKLFIFLLRDREYIYIYLDLKTAYNFRKVKIFLPEHVLVFYFMKVGCLYSWDRLWNEPTLKSISGTIVCPWKQMSRKAFYSLKIASLLLKGLYWRAIYRNVPPHPQFPE